MVLPGSSFLGFFYLLFVGNDMCEVADKIHEFYLQLIELDIVSIQ